MKQIKQLMEANGVRDADKNGDTVLRKQRVADCFYACKVMAVLLHPIAGSGWRVEQNI